jgi:hypothetical protein
MANDSLIPFLTKTRTSQLCEILYKNTGEKASSYSDLAYKIANMYDNAVDKAEIEKQLASIHPHRTFILRNLGSESKKDKEKEITELANLVEVINPTPPNPIEETSNCEGNPNCSCNKSKFSGACGCGSHFDGEQESKPKVNVDKLLAWSGMFCTVAMTLGIIIIAMNSVNRKNYIV